MNKKNKPLNSTNKIETFTGSIDQLLAHCSKLEFDITDEEHYKNEYDLCIKVLMEQEHMSKEEAIECMEIVAQEQLKCTLDDMIEDGLLEITGYNEKGEPLYGTTELGDKCSTKIKKTSKKKK